jgi:hypothetical protein
MSEGGGRDRLGVRVRTIADEWFWALALVAVVLAGVGGYAAYTAYESPGTTVEQRQVASWEGNGSYATTATVTELNPLYPVGTELEDRPAYFLSVSPRLDGTFAFEYRASRGGAVDVTIEQTLVLRGVADESDAPIEYWRLEEPLDVAEANDVGPGDPVRSTFSRNVSRASERIENVSDRLGGTPGRTEILVVSAIDVEGEINGQSVDRSETYRLPIRVDESTYRPAAIRGESLSGSTTERIARERTYGPLWRVGGPAALLVGLIGLAGLAYGRSEGLFAVSAAERDRLEFRSTREEFDDWITTARLPSAVLDRPRVEVESLEGLVDTAIDVDARVFERPDGSAFHVPHEGLLYVYTPPSGTGSSEAVEGSSTTGTEPSELLDDADET